MMTHFLLGFWLGAIANAAGLAEDPGRITLEDVRAAHAARADSIRTLVIDEIVQTHRTRSPDDLERLRQTMEDRVLRQRERLLGDPSCEPLAPEELIKLEIRVREEVNTELPDQVLAVTHANADLRTREKATIDFARQRSCREQRDLRDLARLARENSIPESQLRNLTATRTLIDTASYSIIVNDDATLATVLRGSTTPIEHRRALLGIASPRMLAGTLPTTVQPRGDGTIAVQAKMRDSEQVAFELTLQNAPGYPMTKLVQYGADGALVRELRLSDYRVVHGGVALPYHSEFLQTSASGVQNETRDVQEVVLNSEVVRKTFLPPRKARLHGFDLDAARALNVEQKSQAE